MILSIHLAEPGPRAALAALRRSPETADGLVWAQSAATVPFARGVLTPPRPNGAGLIAAWRDDAALERFLAEDRLAATLAGGWRARLEPLRASGFWSELPGLGEPERPVTDDEPVAVLTLGRLRLLQAARFVRASRPAERQAGADPAVLLATALVRPPRFVATFSIWSTAAAMRAYAYGARDDPHPSAMRVHRHRPLHHESIFARFRPHDAHGCWRGLSPLTLR